MRNRKPDRELAGWWFTLEELSGDCWRAQGRHVDGRFIIRTDLDETRALERCIRDASARRLPAKPIAQRRNGYPRHPYIAPRNPSRAG